METSMYLSSQSNRPQLARSTEKPQLYTIEATVTTNGGVYAQTEKARFSAFEFPDKRSIPAKWQTFVDPWHTKA